MSGGLAELLERITVSDDGLRADVDGQEIRVESLPDMRPSLTNVIYQRVHCGSSAERLPVHVQNPELTRRLRARLGDRLRPVTAPLVENSGDTESGVLVTLDGIRVSVPADRVVTADDDEATVAVSRLRPMLSPGFFLVLGDTPPDPITRVYLRGEDADAHVELFADLVEMLDDRVPYRAKVLTMGGQYPRNDAIVLYLSEPDDELLGEIVTRAQRSPVSDIVSPFTHRIGHGVAIASEPRPDESGVARSFGEHRAEALARALLESRSAGASLDAVADVLRGIGIDPQRLDLDLPVPAPSGAFSTGGR